MLAPLAVSVDDSPGLIVFGEAVAVTVGVGLTVIVMLADPVQPPLLLPVTV